MRKYGGRLIYEDHDDDGIVEVIDDGGLRSLHFGSQPRQSTMSLDKPDELVLAYVRAMTSWQLFMPALTGEVLVVGLGGGSISKYLFQHFPDCQLKIIETRRSVVKLARRYFGLPVDPRINILIGDGGDYVCRNRDSQQNRYSLLMIDAFDHEGVAPSINREVFFQAARSLLTKNGILVINLWGGTAEPQFQRIAHWLGESFAWQTLFLPVLDRGNIIGLAFNQANSRYALAQIKDKASTLEQEFHIEFPLFLKALKKHNASTFDQLVTS